MAKLVSFSRPPWFTFHFRRWVWAPDCIANQSHIRPGLQSGSGIRAPSEALFCPPLTAQQIQYREAVRALGNDDHHLMHVELTNWKVRTGAIIALDDNGFQLRDGIFDSKRISYSQLRDHPCRGTHIANGLK